MTSRTLTTDATARREATPDLATVEVTATGDGESAAVARSTARDRAATVRESVTAAPSDRVRTVDFQIEDASEAFAPDIDAGYRATERLRVDCVPETVERVVVDATDAGGTVRDVQFRIHEDVRRRLRDEALAAATNRAREKAERVAAAEGLVVDGVRDVTTGEVSSGMESIVDEALESSPDTDLHPAPVTVSGAVEVVYDLAEE